MHAKACRFRRKAVRHHTRHDVTRISASTEVLPQDHLNTGGTGPSVDVDQENHADHIVGGRRIDLAIPVMIGFRDDRPCYGTSGFRIAHTGFGRRLAVGPGHGTTHPRMHGGTFGDTILASDAGSSRICVNGVHAIEIRDGRRTQMHHFTTNRRYGDPCRQFAGFNAHYRRLSILWHVFVPRIVTGAAYATTIPTVLYSTGG